MRSFLQRCSNVLRTPVCCRLDDADACPALSINEGVRAVRVIYFGNDNPAGRRPMQRRCDIAGPNSPSRAVCKLYDVTLVVLLDAHTVSHVGI